MVIKYKPTTVFGIWKTEELFVYLQYEITSKPNDKRECVEFGKAKNSSYIIS